MNKKIALVFALVFALLLAGCKNVEPHTPDTSDNTESGDTLPADTDTITDIDDWDKLNWTQEPHGKFKRAHNAYTFIHNLVSGESNIPEYNGLGIKDYSITLLDDSGPETIFRFTFTVTGNSLPETLPPGTYTKIVVDGMDVFLYDNEKPVEYEEYVAADLAKKGLDTFGDNQAVQAVNAYLSMMSWEISPYGEWDITNGILPSNYICKFYGDENMEIGFDEMQKLLSEKFGITINKPTENHRFYRCEYSKATDTVRYADTRGYETIHRFIDVKTENGITYVTVQHFADRLYLIPSHKVVYKIGESEVFLGCEITETGNYEPYELR